MLKAIERLRPLVEQHNDLRGSRNGDHGLEDDPHLLDANPLSSPAALLAFKDAFNLPAFEKNIKGYRAFVTSWEKTNGKSKRVLCHNDAQYGNLLIRLANDTCPQTAAQDVPVEEQLSNSQQMIIVVDFEYAALNPRGYDIGMF